MIKFNSIIVLFLGLTSCGVYKHNGEKMPPVNHDQFTELLQKHVSEEGFVDYKGFESDRYKLKSYLYLLESTAPNPDWSKEEQMAYWINVYNAFTVELVLKHYPVKSIKDIGSSIQVPFVNTPWDIKFIKIGGEEYDLNNIEHGILREEWQEPRVHFALNCASYSCPRLRNEAFTADKLEMQLDDQAKIFINDDFRNDITSDQAKVSKIFSWFSSDFKNIMPVKDFINQYADVKIADGTDLEYKGYDWNLNDVK